MEFDEAVNVGHSYTAKVSLEGVAPRSRQARIGKELAGLAASLPTTLSSSVFVRVDQTHMTLWKALITGVSADLHVCYAVKFSGQEAWTCHVSVLRSSVFHKPVQASHHILY